MQNMQKICQKICKPVLNMQNSDKSIRWSYSAYFAYIYTPHFADGRWPSVTVTVRRRVTGTGLRLLRRRRPGAIQDRHARGLWGYIVEAGPSRNFIRVRETASHSGCRPAALRRHESDAQEIFILTGKLLLGSVTGRDPFPLIFLMSSCSRSESGNRLFHNKSNRPASVAWSPLLALCTPTGKACPEQTRCLKINGSSIASNFIAENWEKWRAMLIQLPQRPQGKILLLVKLIAVVCSLPRLEGWYQSHLHWAFVSNAD